MKIALLLSALLLLPSCTKFFKAYTPDNPTEEFIEEVIKKQTGIEVDLSPWATEKEENQFDKP